jgi:NADPH-dependent 2,4-dienoyl-CoA reductase/sulfur reductase-like enzyme
MPTRYVIVGNGPAGATAAQAICQNDTTAEVHIVGAEKHAFYSRPGLAYYLTGQIPEGALFSRPDKQLDRARVKRTVGRVVAVDPRAHRAELADGEVLRYDRLLLGVGATAVRPDVEGIGLEGVVTLDSVDDARLILKLAKKAKRAVVVGGGITAIELAEGLVANGVKVDYLMRGDRYWASVLDERESALVEARLEHDGVVIHRNTELGRVVGHNHRVTTIETREGERLRADMLAVAVGTQVRLDLAKQIDLETGRGIFTDDRLATSDPDIYAAGDAAEVLDPASGRRGIDSLWSVAIAQGRVAGANMAGASESYMPRPAPFNVTRIGGVTTTLIGAVGAGGRDGDLIALARGDSNAWREQLDGFAVATDSGANHLRLILSEDRILGAVVMGDQSLSRALLHVIRARLDIRDVRDRLLEGQAEVRQALATVMERTAPHAV